MANIQDPFDHVKLRYMNSQVVENMKTLQALYARHMQLMNGNLQSKTEFDEITWIRSQLDTNVKNVEYDLKDLDETIQIVESDRVSYSQFSDLEIQSRKLFVGQTRKEIKTIKDNVFSKKAQSRLQNQQRNALLPQETKRPVGNGGSAQLNSIVHQENEQFLQAHRQEQTNIMQQQDNLAEVAITSLTNIQQVAVDMGREIDGQSKDLNSLQTSVEKNKNIISRAARRLDNFMNQQSDAGKIGCIVVLVIIIFAILGGIIVIDFI